MEYAKLFAATFVSVFVIIDPFAALPVFAAVTQRFAERDRLIICRRASMVAAAILIVVALSGDFLFRLFGITIPAFQIAGGLLLLSLGMAQLDAGRSRVRDDEELESHERDDVSIFPLATPLLAGPGAISTIVLLASNNQTLTNRIVLASSIILALTCSYLIIRHGQIFIKMLGKTGLNLLTRIMGILLAAIAVQFIINGLQSVVSTFLNR